MTEQDKHFMQHAIQLAEKGMRAKEGGPFGAVVVKDDKIIGEGWNRVTSTNDPTAHAEVMAIREACAYLYAFQLEDCTIYTSCEPCPMCLGAIYWARPKRVVYACNKQDAADIDFDDQFIYDEIAKEMDSRQIEFSQLMQKEGKEVFNTWKNMDHKTLY